MSAFITIPGLDFDIFIRGLLVVVVAVVVLMGSVYLLLATNSGARTGMLIALTGFFGWMVIMGLIWWIYGIGLHGRLPTWEVYQVNRGDLTQALHQNERALGEGIVRDLGADPGNPAEVLVEVFESAELAQEPPVAAGWRGMLAADRARGEAQAAADAFLTGNDFFDVGAYVPVGAFRVGGKAERDPDNNVFQDAMHRLHSIFVQPFHPPHYAAVMVQAATPASLNIRPGEAPPTREIDPEQPMYTVFLERDLGDERLPPALITIGSLVLFGVFAQRLHVRDRREAESRTAYEASVRGR